MKEEIKFTEGSISLKEKILIMTLPLGDRFSVYTSVTF